jgi:hypothetical protein
MKQSGITVIMKWLRGRLFNAREPYNRLPPDRFRKAIRHPWVRRKLVTVSIEQDEEGSHYHGILNTIANDCLGPAPLLIGGASDPTVNTEIEDRWVQFCQETGLGSSLRLLRRAAARTGIGIGIPFRKETDHEVKLGLRIISSEKLLNPLGGNADDRWYDGIHYNRNWEPDMIGLDTGETYAIKDIIVWWKNKFEDQLCGIPECAPALCIFPSVKRYLDAVIRSAEFRSAIPMALKLDPTIWGKEAAESVGMPEGEFQYEPGMIPTLPPGTTLEGLSYSGTTSEDAAALDAMVGAAARCVNMPINLATGNSSKHNMASSQVDFGPWKNTVLIDREDFAPVIHKMVKIWYNGASKVPGYFSGLTRRYIQEEGLLYSLSYSQVFNHPDPQKISNATATDLTTGALTLVRYYTERGRNPRRELQREAELLGVEYEDLCKIILAGRTTAASSILSSEETTDEEQTEKTSEER